MLNNSYTGPTHFTETEIRFELCLIRKELYGFDERPRLIAISRSSGGLWTRCLLIAYRLQVRVVSVVLDLCCGYAQLLQAIS